MRTWTALLTVVALVAAAVSVGLAGASPQTVKVTKATTVRSAVQVRIVLSPPPGFSDLPRFRKAPQKTSPAAHPAVSAGLFGPTGSAHIVIHL